MPAAETIGAAALRAVAAASLASDDTSPATDFIEPEIVSAAVESALDAADVV